MVKLAESRCAGATRGVGFGRTRRHDSDSLAHIKAKVVHACVGGGCGGGVVKSWWFLWGHPSCFFVFFCAEKADSPSPETSGGSGMLQSARPYPSGVYTVCHA